MKSGVHAVSQGVCFLLFLLVLYCIGEIVGLTFPGNDQETHKNKQCIWRKIPLIVVGSDYHIHPFEEIS